LREADAFLAMTTAVIITMAAFGSVLDRVIMRPVYMKAST
jgi:hypothetical protein